MSKSIQPESGVAFGHTYLRFYNHDRVHHGRLTHGRIPAEIVDGARKMEAQ